MEQTKVLGKNKYITLSQSFGGHTVKTFSVNGNNVKTFASKELSNISDAKKEFTRQKRMFK